MVPVRIAMIKSRVKGRHLNKSIISAKNWNANSRLKINIVIILSWYWRKRKTKSQKEKQAKSRINGGLRFFHIPDALAEILFPLMNAWRVYSTETIISENHRAAPEGKWVPGGGIEM